MSEDARLLKLIEPVLKHEGSVLSLDPDDPGLATKFGVSLRWLRSCKDIDPQTGYMVGDLDHDHDVDADDIREMTRIDAIRIYQAQWWDRYRYGLIEDDAVAGKLLDFSVHTGPGRAHRLIQVACNNVGIPGQLAVDGILGQQTIAAINSRPSQQYLLAMLRLEGIKFYTSLNQPKYLRGWINRALD